MSVTKGMLWFHSHLYSVLIGILLTLTEVNLNLLGGIWLTYAVVMRVTNGQWSGALQGKDAPLSWSISSQWP